MARCTEFSLLDAVRRGPVVIILVAIFALALSQAVMGAPGFTVAAVAMAKPTKSHHAELSATESKAVEKLHSKLNNTRKKVKRKPLVLNPALSTIAQKWAEKMLAAKSLEHNPKVGSQIPKNWRSWGENIGMARGYDNNTNVIHTGWVDSPPHYSSMIAAKFSQVGIGYAIGPGNTAYAVQVFAHYAVDSFPRVLKMSRKSVKRHGTTKVTITGRNFGGLQYVKVGSQRAKVLSKSSSRIVISVPKKLTGKAQVKVVTKIGASKKTSKATLAYRK